MVGGMKYKVIQALFDLEKYTFVKPVIFMNRGLRQLSSIIQEASLTMRVYLKWSLSERDTQLISKNLDVFQNKLDSDIQ